jgi:organic radical activating enzyme
MELIIEVTRNCNQECMHCLRGEQQNIRIKNEYITSMLEQIKTLDVCYNVCFTGGEPTLNLEAIEFYMEECKRLNINHDSFYIVTNGNDLGMEFIKTCLKLYALAGDKEFCKVDLSNDNAHEYIEDEELELIKGLSFFSNKFDENLYWDIDNVIYEGNAKENFSRGRIKSVHEINNKEELNDTEVYLNCKGNIINGCDWSYESQDNREDIFICQVDKFVEYYNSLPDDSYNESEFEYA